MDTQKKMTPYLVQRATFKDFKTIEGIDSILSFEYMGSAEFEFGALPTSLKAIIQKLSSLEIVCLKQFQRPDGSRLFLICTQDQIQDITDFFQDQSLKHPKAFLKEYTNFYRSLNQCGWNDNKLTDNDARWLTSCWWDIENHWFATFGKKSAENILLAIQKVKEKKGW